MNYINPPAESPENITHATFFSHVLNHDIGYNIYLPPDYEESGKGYPAAYHIHGWQGNESSDIWALEKVCRNRQSVTVFINASVSSEDEYFAAVWQLESIFIKELIPHIDGRYRTSIIHENRMLSGFSMGGYPVKAILRKNNSRFFMPESFMRWESKSRSSSVSRIFISILRFKPIKSPFITKI